MDTGFIAPALPPPISKSYTPSDTISKPSYKARSISVEDLRLKFRRGVSLQDPIQSRWRPCQQAYLGIKSNHHGIYSEDMALFESHQTMDTNDRAEGRPRLPGSPVRNNYVPKRMPDIEELCEGTNDDFDIWSLTRCASLARSSLPCPHKSWNRVGIKASGDFAHSLMQCKSIATPTKKDPGGEEKVIDSADSLTSKHPLTDDVNNGQGQAKTEPIESITLTEKITTTGLVDDKGKQCFLHSSALLRKLTTVKSVGQVILKEQRVERLHHLVSPAIPGEDVPNVHACAAKTASDQPRKVKTEEMTLSVRDSQGTTQLPPLALVRRIENDEHVLSNHVHGQSRKRFNLLPLAFGSKKIIEDQLRARGGEKHAQLSEKQLLAKQKEGCEQNMKQQFRDRELEEYEQEKFRLFASLNVTREKRENDLKAREIKRLRGVGDDVSDSWQLPPERKLIKLHFDADLEVDAQITANERDAFELEESRCSIDMNATVPPQPTEIWEDEVTEQVRLVGPPHKGANFTGHFWSTGAHHRHGSPGGRRGRLSAAAENEYEHRCLCKSHVVWSAITDAEYRYIGLARTKKAQRWVVHLAKERPCARLKRLGAGEKMQQAAFDDIRLNKPAHDETFATSPSANGLLVSAAQKETKPRHHCVGQDEILKHPDDSTPEPPQPGAHSPSPSPRTHTARQQPLQRHNTTASSYYGEDDEAPLMPIESTLPLNMREAAPVFDLDNPPWPGDAGPEPRPYRPTIRTSSLSYTYTYPGSNAEMEKQVHRRGRPAENRLAVRGHECLAPLPPGS